MSRARSSLAYLPDMSRDSLRGFAHLGLLATLLQSFPKLRVSVRAPEKKKRPKPLKSFYSFYVSSRGSESLVGHDRRSLICVAACVNTSESIY